MHRFGGDMNRPVEYEERVAFRARLKDVETVRQAAAIEGTTVSGFVRRATLQVAQDVVALAMLDRELGKADAD